MITPTKLEFTARVGEPIATQTLQISSVHDNEQWKVFKITEAKWLGIDRESGVGEDVVRISANVVGLDVGEYKTELAVVSSGTPRPIVKQRIKVTLKIV